MSGRAWAVVAALVAVAVGLGVVVRRGGAPTPAAAAPSCATCHPAEAASWAGSHHARAQRAAAPGEVWAVDGVERPVVGWIGVAPLEQALVDLGHGDLHVTQLARDTRDGSAFDVFGDGRQPGEWGHWTGEGMAWNRACARCHVSGWQKGWDGTRYQSDARRWGIDCEQCHPAAGEPGPGHAAVDASVDGCAACHARRAELTPTDPQRFLDGFAPALVDRSDGFWPDGRVRDEMFEWTSFIGSRMHAAGVRCVDCHEPHGGGLRRPGDALCRGCHDGLGTAAHSRHVGVTCVDCHMPVTVYMGRHARHDHGFAIPDPWLAKAIGAPDPCGGCHAGADTAAMAEGLWGEGRGPRRRALATARARAGDAAAIPALLEQLAGGAPAWRASAALLLAAWADAPEVAGALVAASRDPEPLVRFGAVTALHDRTALEAALGDPVAAVRVAAARGLGRRAPDLEVYLDHNRDQPDARVEAGVLAFAEGRTETAVAELRAALALDPGRVDALDALAVVWASDGRAAAAADALGVAVGLRPDDAELRLRWGLALAGAGDREGAERALASSAELGHARAGYNLGLLRAERGDHAGALRALFAAEAIVDDVDTRYAIASVLLRWGRVDEARHAAKRVLALDPSHAGAAQILAAP